MKTTAQCFLIAVFGMTCWSSPATAQEKEAGREAFMKLAMPGEYHRRLEPLVGKWNLVLKSEGGPGGQRAESKGTAEFKWILGQRFLAEEAKCELFGQPFEWAGLYGYDNMKKKYVATWVDSFGTDIERGEATADATGKVFAFSGEHNDPRTGRKEKFKWVITVEDKDRMRVEMLELDPKGKDSKVLEITGTRTQAAQLNSVPVEGRLLFNGKPLAGATIMFMPEPDPARPGRLRQANAYTGPDGKFKMSTVNRAGVEPGGYLVVITKKVLPPGIKRPDPNKINMLELQKLAAQMIESVPKVYTSNKTTPIRVEIPASGIKELRIELKGTPPPDGPPTS